MKKDYIKEKQELFDEIQEFLNSVELTSVRNKILQLQKKFNAIPKREKKFCDNFTNLYVAFSNMMSWADNFNWDRNKKYFDDIAIQEVKRREILCKLKSVN